jgi:adenine-specific DNA-methyltransferase|tara:strand:- start:116 stop:442 length:327 start_codon:yes stop_codon:yes gene_type:complete
MIKPAIFQETNNKHQVFQKDDNKLIKSITGDLLYLDPSYSARQYGANYHLLNTIAKYDIFAPKGVTGLRDYCKKIVLQSFTELLKNAHFRKNQLKNKRYVFRKSKRYF